MYKENIFIETPPNNLGSDLVLIESEIDNDQKQNNIYFTHESDCSIGSLNSAVISIPNNYPIGIPNVVVWKPSVDNDNLRIEHLKKSKFIEDKPNQSSIYHAKKILNRLYDLGFDSLNIVASPEGGVMLEFIEDDIYHLIEIYNDGDFVFLRRKGTDRSAYDFDSFENLLIFLSDQFNVKRM